MLRKANSEIVLVSDEYITAGGVMGAEQLAESRKNTAAHPRKSIYERESMRTDRVCPFSNKSDNECSRECALYRDGCTLAHQKHGGGETAGRPCPFVFLHKCTDRCALYDGGCRMSIIRQGGKK